MRTFEACIPALLMMAIAYLFGLLPLWFAGVFALGVTLGQKPWK